MSTKSWRWSTPITSSLARDFHDELSKGEFDDELDIMDIDYFHDDMSDA